MHGVFLGSVVSDATCVDRSRRLALDMRPLLLLLLALSSFSADAGTWAVLPAEVRALVDQILERNQVLEPELDAEAARTAFAALVEAARPASGTTAPREVIDGLNRAILGGRKVSYLSRQYWRDSSFVAALVRRQGNCLATSTLYVAVGRALGLPIHAVFVPEHAFVCWAGAGRRINIETTAGGAVTDDRVYLSRFALDGGDMAYFAWMTPMSDARLLAELDVVVAQHLAGQQNFSKAVDRLASARTVLTQRRDLELLSLSWTAQSTGERKPLVELAQRIAADEQAPRAARLAAVNTLAGEHRARLDRKAEKEALLQAYRLAQWHEQDELLTHLSTCLRGLRDHTGAVLCMELAVAKDPQNIGKRAWLAGMLSEAGRLDEGLAMLAKVREENPEESYFATMEAGMLVLAGRRDEGRKQFDAIAPPRTGIENFEINRAWFLAVWGDRAEFYPQFERALSMAKDPSILSWVAEDDDLDKFRQDERFKEVVETNRQRLLGKTGSP
jgi:tetratricopeptide (TPR) repeat protein